MIERWNKVVSPYDTVYHLGDFGNLDMLKYLNGKIIFLKGNYEKDEENLPFDEIVEYNTPIKLKLNDKFEVSLVHRPLLHDGYTLFGHIHGRQKVKKFGLDVGVDCNNFTPVSKDEVLFYFNAIDKKYYDEDVFC
jgi:calcineurin-like phosphoesterase family protein